MTPQRHPAPVLGAENPTYTPTTEDLHEMGDHFARLEEVLDICPWCGATVQVGDDSDRVGGRYLHSRCVRELVEQDARYSPDAGE